LRREKRRLDGPHLCRPLRAAGPLDYEDGLDIVPITVRELLEHERVAV
jgi:hypothetical protein